MGDIAGEEHRVQIAAGASSDRQDKVAAPEKWVNCFVRVVALMERTGNALGTLAFTWATVVFLGGYPAVLDSHGDFWMFSRNNRFDYQLFFRTRVSRLRFPIIINRIPAALVREELARMRLTQHDSFGVGEKTNLGQSLTILCSMRSDKITTPGETHHFNADEGQVDQHVGLD
ncbi:hypothetical protein OsI_33049 [Oryza sativa Indica Group]|uniref:Uncharacterized protein n=1 Tax=Oryza sativa subsp. indica TaxID=39946 RepID=B8BG63_ORYSI|nr:hypothetical protein OsI_33049 [Oryza sativa Indica Group]